MPISKTKNYLVLNYNSSPVGISTKHESYLVEGGTREAPGSLPLTFDEISVVNSNSPAFKIGLLRFEPEYEAELYDSLSIRDWKNIFTIEQIEKALTEPDMETSQKILDIENDAYFERIRGVMIGLRNSGVDIPGKMERMIEQRRLELARRQRKTEIKLVSTVPEKKVGPSQEEFDSMKAQLESMRQMMEKLASVSSTDTDINRQAAGGTAKKAKGSSK